MLVKVDERDYVSESSHRTCGHHLRHPEDVSYAGCTCSSSFSLRKLTPFERMEKEKREEHLKGKTIIVVFASPEEADELTKDYKCVIVKS